MEHGFEGNFMPQYMHDDVQSRLLLQTLYNSLQCEYIMLDTLYQRQMSVRIRCLFATFINKPAL